MTGGGSRPTPDAAALIPASGGAATLNHTQVVIKQARRIVGGAQCAQARPRLWRVALLGDVGLLGEIGFADIAAYFVRVE